MALGTYNPRGPNNQVVPYTETWKRDYEEEIKIVLAAIGDVSIEFHHVGSTAVPGILAKPIIDILGIVDELGSIDPKGNEMRSIGYEVLGEHGIDGRRYYRKIAESGRRTHHIHVFAKGSFEIERHLAFRDYLIAHPEAAEAYGEVKKKLIERPFVTWDEYLNGKSGFILRTEAKALRWIREQSR